MLSSPACLQALRVSGDTGDASVRLNWKGSEDPWMQIDLDGDTVRVYRQSMLQGSFGQVRERYRYCRVKNG